MIFPKILANTIKRHLSPNEVIKSCQNILQEIKTGSSFFCTKTVTISMDIPTRKTLGIEQNINKSQMWGK